MGKIIFRLTAAGKTPSTWQLPQTNVMGTKPNKGKKFINYYPGQDSCFVEDIEAVNKELKPKKVPIFKYNSASQATELIVDEENKSLVNYLKTHPWYGSKFAIFSKEKQAEDDLKLYDNVEKALELIRDSDENKVKAIAMAVFGLDSFYKTTTQCASELKAKAIKDPVVVINSMSEDDYQTKYLSGLAFVSGIVKLNPTHSAVVWSDNDGVIIHIAQGENGLDKLSEFLRRSSTESEILLQEFQARLDKKLQNTDSNTDQSEIISEKDRKIAELEARLEAQGQSDINDTKTLNDNANLSEIESVQEEYLKAVGTAIPNAYKKNLEWMRSKIAEATKG